MKKKWLLSGLFFLFILIFCYAQSYYENSSQCYGYLTEMVRSSNFPFYYTSKEKTNLLIDTDNRNSYILAQLYFDKKASSDNPNTMATVGWIKYDIQAKKLYNVSGDIDPEKPEELSFTLNYADLFNDCRSCENLEQKANQEGIYYYPRQIFKVTGTGRSYFYSAPNSSCKISNDLFIIPNDKVIVYSEYEDFYFVMYIRKTGTDVSGWIYKKLLMSTGETISPKDH